MGGIFSVEYPIIASCYDDYNRGIKRGSWKVDNYFHRGERENIWMGKHVIKFHRTLEDYFHLIKQAGLRIDEIREARPDPAYFKDQNELARRMRIPLFLIMRLVSE